MSTVPVVTPDQYNQILYMLKGKTTETTASIATAPNSLGIITALMSNMTNNSLIVDTGASNNMVHNLNVLNQCKELTNGNTTKVNLPTGGQVSIIHICNSIVFKDKTVHNVLFIPEFKYNQLSV